MLRRRLRIEHASKFFSQAQVDLRLANHVYQGIATEMEGNSHPFLCGIIAYSQHALKAARRILQIVSTAPF